MPRILQDFWGYTMKTTFAVLALLLFAGVSRADSIWDYQGGVMQGCGCALTGEVTLDTSGDVGAWSFTDGTHVLTSLDSVGYVSPLGAFQDPSFGPFGLTWYVNVRRTTDSWGILIDYYGSAFEATDASGVNAGTSPAGTYGYLQGQPGVWTESVPTAEPGTLALIGVGLVGLLARKRLQAKSNQVPEAVWEALA
jgi:PEP-CTERM motif